MPSSEGSLGTILVTGGAGWLSSHIVEVLVTDPSFSQVISSIEPEATHCHQIPGANYHDCDISNSKYLKILLDTVKPRIIMHSFGPGFFAAPEFHRRATYDLSKQLIAVARNHPSVQAVVYTGTVEAIDMKKPTLPKPFENTTGNYEDQLLTTVLRVTALYGPRDRLTVAEILKLVDIPKTKFQIGPNALFHDWIHVKNCARAHILAAKALVSPIGERADGRGFFVSDGKPKRFWDFTRKIWEEAGDANWAQDGPHKVTEIPFCVVLLAVRVLEWIYWTFTFGMVRPSVNTMTFEYMKTGGWFDVSNARDTLGYEPDFDTHEGIRSTVKWFQDNEGWEKET